MAEPKGKTTGHGDAESRRANGFKGQTRQSLKLGRCRRRATEALEHPDGF